VANDFQTVVEGSHPTTTDRTKKKGKSERAK
jgi:hypothetical protein